MLQYLTFGHRRSLSAAMWLNVLTWFGGNHIKYKHNVLSDPQRLHYLQRQIDFVIRLDPYFPDPYAFAALNFMWFTKSPEMSLRYLEAAMVRFPNQWIYPFYYGFVHFHFLKDYGMASTYLYRAGRLPESPRYLLGLAAKFERKGHGTGKAISSLESLTMMEGMLSDDMPKEVMEDIQRELVTLKAIQVVEDAISAYKAKNGKLPTALNLLHEGYLAEIPKDAYGRVLEIEADGSITTSLGRQ